jgi:ADP-heptose:LPS heptosyltransferase/GT2 family glycosyltransferase
MNTLYTICILCHDNLDLTKKCLESVFRSTDIEQAQVILIDNGSTDKTVEYTHRLFYEMKEALAQGRVGMFTVISTGENLWIGKAYNLGLKHSNARYFVTLNNDIEILDPAWLSKMRQPFCDDPEMALVGVTDTCGHLDAVGCGYKGDPEEPLDYIEGSCMMARTDLVSQYGLFDPVFRLGYCEDADLSLRMRKRGYHIARVDVKISHVAGATSDLIAGRGVDVAGYQLINNVTLNRRWGRYLQKRNFMERVAILRTGAIGDVIQTTPLLHAIETENPSTKIYLFTDCPQVLRGNPDVWAVSPAADYRIAYQTFDKAVNLDLAYELRPNMPIIDAYAECAQVTVSDRSMHVYTDPQERVWAKKQMPGPKWAVIHPHTGQEWPGKNWHGFDELARRLRADRWCVAVVGNDSSTVECDLDLRGKTTFHELAAIIERCDLFVGVDSAPMNIAQAFLVSTVGIFGATNPRNILLPMPFIRAASVPMDACGCLGCHGMYAPPRLTPCCIRDTDLCMEKLTVDRVLDVIAGTLERTGNERRNTIQT